MSSAESSFAEGSRWERWWFAPMPLTRLAIFRALVMALALVDLLAYAPAFVHGNALAHAGAQGAHFDPIYLVDVLGLEPISAEHAALVVRFGVVAALLGIVGLASNASCAVAGLALFYVAGMVYSFEKVHHDKVALAFALAALPFAPVGARGSLDAVLRRAWSAWKGVDARPVSAESDLAGVPIRLTQASLAIGYGCAALSKLTVSGPEWANGYTLMAFLAEFDKPWSRWVGGGVERSAVCSVAVLAIQLGFPLVLVWRRSAWFLLPAVLGAHVVNWMTLDTGPYMSLWFLLIAFLPLERVPAWVREQLSSRSPLRRVFGVLAPAAPAALVAWLWFDRYLPHWALVVWIPILATLALAASRRPRTVVRYTASCARSRVAATAVEALDWSRRVALEPRKDGARGLGSLQVDRNGRVHRGWRAWIALARELPLTAPLARGWRMPS